jgi:hypothetical protein
MSEACLQKVYNEKAVDKMFKDRKAMLNALAKMMPKGKNQTLKTLDQFRKEKKEEYRKFFCNPGCKHTVFESGPANKLSNSFKKSLKKKNKASNLSNYQLSRRKELFGKNKNILEDNFYKGLDAKTRKKLKKHGAISGCMSIYKNNPPL